MRDLKAMLSRSRFSPVALAIAILAGLTLWFVWPRADKTAVTAPKPTPRVTSGAQQPAPAVPSGTTPQELREAEPTQPAAIVAHPVPIAETARIEFITNPSVDATVTWGKKKIGVIARRRPLVLNRPRDSGPMDVVVTAEGFLPVHTRAHTFGDNKVIVKLTAIDQQSTLLGYRAPIDAGVQLVLDGGDPSLLAPSPPPFPSLPPAASPPPPPSLSPAPSPPPIP